MTSLPNDAFLPEENMDEDYETPKFEEEEDDEGADVFCEPCDDDDDDETGPSPSLFSAITNAVVALPCSFVSNASTPRTSTLLAVSPEPKRQLTEQLQEKKALDDSRKLFQRLWTDEDEIGLLLGFLEYTTNRGSSHHSDTAMFYDQIKSKLQFDFNKNQLIEKIRRLKKKYRKTLNKIVSGKDFSFKSPHDQATFEISRKIWSNNAPIGGSVEDDDEIKSNSNSTHTTPLKSGTVNAKKSPRKRLRMRTEGNDSSVLNNDYNNTNNNNNDSNISNNNNCSGKNSLKSLIEEKVRSCLSPVLKELVSSGMGSSPFGFALNTMPLSFLHVEEMVVDDKWRKQQVLELEVYSKRLELVQEEIKVALEDFRSAGAERVGNY